jgi:hypothetical protein
MVNESRNKKMKAINQPRRSAWAALGVLLTLALASCDYEVSSAIENPPPFTQILRVDVIPNPVAAGDSLTLRCLTIDNLPTGYTFVWSTSQGFLYTSSPTVRIKALNIPGSHDFRVRVRKDVTNYLFPGRRFLVEVIP